MNALEAINARIRDNEKSAARAERVKKEAEDEVKHCREALEEDRETAATLETLLAEALKNVATSETRLKVSLERAKVASKELEDARVALEDSEKAVVVIDDSDDQEKDVDVIYVNEEFLADAISRDAVPEKVLVEGCEQHAVNGVYKLNGFDFAGYPTYVKDCQSDLYEIEFCGHVGWIISHKRKESEETSDNLYFIYIDGDFWEDLLPSLFITTGWCSLDNNGNKGTALKVKPVN